MGHSFEIQKHFQGWPLLYRAQSWFKAVMYWRKFWIALSHRRNAFFSHLSLLAFETNPQGHFMGIFSSRFHSVGQLWKFNSGQWALEYTRAVLFGAGLVWLLPVANNATQHGLSDNSNEYLIQIFVLIVTRFNPNCFVPTPIVANITSTHIERIGLYGDSLPKFGSENLIDSREIAEASVYICLRLYFFVFVFFSCFFSSLFVCFAQSKISTTDCGDFPDPQDGLGTTSIK